MGTLLPKVDENSGIKSTLYCLFLLNETPSFAVIDIAGDTVMLAPSTTLWTTVGSTAPVADVFSSLA